MVTTNKKFGRQIKAGYCLKKEEKSPSSNDKFPPLYFVNKPANLQNLHNQFGAMSFWFPIGQTKLMRHAWYRVDFTDSN
jgi:hypothetical protein